MAKSIARKAAAGHMGRHGRKSKRG